MPSKSKSQQRFFSMVKKCKDTGDCASKDIEKTSQTMSKKDINTNCHTLYVCIHVLMRQACVLLVGGLFVYYTVVFSRIATRL